MTATAMRVPYTYLDRLFSDRAAILADIDRLAASGDFTLGAPVREFEDRVKAVTRLPFAVGVASGTDGITLPLLALGVGHGDEVITASNSFVASAGAIAMTGATPVLVDNLEDFTIDPDAVEAAITPRTRAIVPVHLTGTIADMPRLAEIARRHDLHIVEDAAQAFGATLDGLHVGSWGEAASISLHPLKMMNVWGDGGVVVTRDRAMSEQLRLLRNHGLASRDDAVVFGANGRLSSLQAVVANHVIQQVEGAIARRQHNARQMSDMLCPLAPMVQTPIIRPGVSPIYQTYMIRAERRDALREHLLAAGVDVKIHYPKPIHLQTVGRNLGYREGQLPVAERHAQTILTLPMHEYLSGDELAYMAVAIHAFYRGGR